MCIHYMDTSSEHRKKYEYNINKLNGLPYIVRCWFTTKLVEVLYNVSSRNSIRGGGLGRDVVG